MHTEHARIAPSSLDVLVHCPGSLRVQQRNPEQSDRDAANAGAVTHNDAAAEFAGVDTGNPRAKEYVNYVLRETGGEPPVVEKRVRIPRVHLSECWGTPDSWWFDPVGRVLKVFDLKTGWGLHEPFRHWQTMAYSSGVIDTELPVGIEPDLNLEIHICQPGIPHIAGPFRVWRCKASAIRPYVNMMANSAEEALGTDPRTIAGTHCRYCSGRHDCRSNRRTSFSAIGVADSFYGLDLTPEAAGEELRLLTEGLEVLKSRITGLEAVVEAGVRSGQPSGGWYLESKQGNREWISEPRVICETAGLFGVEVKKPGLITPTQAIAAGLPKDIVARLSRRKPGSSKLKFDDGSLAEQYCGE